MTKRLIGICIVIAVTIFSIPSAMADSIAARQLVAKLIPENQPFIVGAAQLFDVRITNIGSTDVHSTMAYLQLLVVDDEPDQIATECGIIEEDASPTSISTDLPRHPNVEQSRVPGSTDKAVVPINLSPGQTMTIYAASDLSCPYSTLKPGTYSVVGAVLLLNGAEIMGQVDSKEVRIVIHR